MKQLVALTLLFLVAAVSAENMFDSLKGAIDAGEKKYGEFGDAKKNYDKYSSKYDELKGKSGDKIGEAKKAAQNFLKRLEKSTADEAEEAAKNLEHDLKKLGEDKPTMEDWKKKAHDAAGELKKLGEDKSVTGDLKGEVEDAEGKLKNLGEDKSTMENLKNKADDAAGNLKKLEENKTEQAVEEAKHTAGDTTDQLKKLAESKAMNEIEKAKNTAKNLQNKLKKLEESKLDETKGKASEALKKLQEKEEKEEKEEEEKEQKEPEKDTAEGVKDTLKKYKDAAKNKMSEAKDFFTKKQEQKGRTGTLQEIYEELEDRLLQTGFQQGHRYAMDPNFDSVPEGGHFSGPGGVTYYVQTPPRSFTPPRPPLYNGRGEHGAPCIGHKDCNSNFGGGRGYRCVNDPAIMKHFGFTLPSSPYHGVCLWLGHGVNGQ